MRNREKIVLDGISYWLRELTVSDVFMVYYESQDLVNDFSSIIAQNKVLVNSIIDCPWELFLDMRVSEVTKFYERVLKLNKNVFRSKEKRSERKRDVNVIDGLFEMCCAMIEAGHVDVLNYGYSFFLKSVNNHELIRNRSTVDFGNAVRIAYHGDDKQWKKYVRGLVGHNVR